MPCSRVTPSAVAYASTTLGATLLASVFGAFYVSVFAKHWGITQGWFQTAQAVYLVWNAVNDPLFGWLQDRPGSQQNNKHAYATAIMWGGPLFGLSFLLPWLPIGDLIAPFVGGRDAGVGIHCCLSLSLFDGMFTYCVLAQCGLFAELEASQEGRSLVLAASQAATALGGAALFVAYPLLPDHLRGTGADSGAGSTAAGELAARDRYDGSGAGGDDDDEDDDDDAGASGGGPSRSCGAELAHVASTWLQILSSPSFCLFVACNFLQVFNNTFNSALHAAAMPAIFRGAFSDAAVGAMLGAGAVLAPLISIALTPLLLRVGHSYPLIRGAFAGKVLFALAVGAAVGSAAPGIASDGAAWWASGVGLAALFMVLHRALANVTFGWFPLAVSDIIDADKAAYRRQRRLGTSVFGLNAMIVKPAESLAPMLFAPVLHDFAAAAAETASSAAAELAPVSGWWSSLLWLLGDPTPADGEVNEAHRAIVAWRLVWGVPAVCGAIQLALWSFYKLRGKADTSVQPASGSKPGERVPEPVRGASV
ncbi:hypothetical protein FNF27_07179 [Cafeteria roenbergensis]|uniref:Uncharacterized protein n=1 Tax=Cafeteria roenbergensis TaxID=33653 RepID=A0A5A8DSY8_CAFRO|nr:hypothetical protein FNF27_07179 [Cafeteria roenbergensis]